MALMASQEILPRWDANKARVLGAAPAGSLPPMPYAEGDLVPGEWWRVEDEGRVVAYGWLELSWGEAQILLAVDPAAQRRGVGAFVLDTLARATAARGSQYMFNAIRDGYPEGDSLSRWLQARGFEPSGDGTLRRRVPHAIAD